MGLLDKIGGSLEMVALRSNPRYMNASPSEKAALEESLKSQGEPDWSVIAEPAPAAESVPSKADKLGSGFLPGGTMQARIDAGQTPAETWSGPNDVHAPLAYPKAPTIEERIAATDEPSAEPSAVPAEQAPSAAPATKEEGQATLDTLADKIDALSPSAEREQFKKDMAAVDAWYKEAQDRMDWMELAERLGHAIVQAGAAYNGMKTGVDMTGLKFDKTDYDSRRQLMFRELEGKRGVVRDTAALNKSLRDEQRAEQELKLREETNQAKLAAAGVKAGEKAKKQSEEEILKRQTEMRQASGNIDATLKSWLDGDISEAEALSSLQETYNNHNISQDPKTLLTDSRSLLEKYTPLGRSKEEVIRDSKVRLSQQHIAGTAPALSKQLTGTAAAPEMVQIRNPQTGEIRTITKEQAIQMGLIK